MNEIWKPIIEKIFSYFGLAWLVFFLVFGGVVTLVCSDILRERLGPPNWSFIEGNGYEAVQPDVPLQGGDMIVYPQIVVEYKGTVVFIVSVDCLYETNKASMSQEDNSEYLFSLTVTEEQRAKFDNLLAEFPQMIKTQLGEDYQYMMDACEIYPSRLAQINYQLASSNVSHANYFYYDSGNQRIIQKKEKDTRQTSYRIDLDKSSNADIREIVMSCADAIIMAGK